MMPNSFFKSAARRNIWGAAFLLAGVVAVGLAASPGRADGWFRGHRHGGGWGDDPAEAREHAQFAAEWVMRKVDATAEQKEKVSAIVGELVDELGPLVRQHRENREEWIVAFSRPSVDRAELVRLRDSEMQLASAAAASLVNAFAEVGTVLTIEQRRELLEAMEHRRGR